MSGPALRLPEPVGVLFWPEGDPPGVLDAGWSLRAMADTCGQITSWIESSQPRWEGAAGTAYLVRAGQIGHGYAAAATALSAGAAALECYGEELEALQRRARRLEEDAAEVDRARHRLLEDHAAATAAGLGPDAPAWGELARTAARLEDRRAEIVGRDARIRYETDQAEQDAAAALSRTGDLTSTARQARTPPPSPPPPPSGGEGGGSHHGWDDIDLDALTDMATDTGWTALGGLGMVVGVGGLAGDGALEIGTAGVATPAVGAAGVGLVGLTAGSGALAAHSVHDLFKDDGRLFSDDGGDPAPQPVSQPPTSGARGPGQWRPVRESMSDRARAYQERITGQSSEYAYVAERPDGRPVRFDSFDDDQNALIDAKGARWDYLLGHRKIGKFARYGLLKQAERQTEAAGGTRIIWYVHEKGAADQMAEILDDERYTNIVVEWRP